MGMRIDCSNPVREFHLTPVLDAHGRITNWQGEIFTGRYYKITLAASPDITNGTPELKCRVQREPTIRENYQIATARRTRQLSFLDVPPELYTKALRLVKATKLICTQTIQRTLSVTYDAAQQIMDNLEIEGYVGPPRDDSKYRDTLKAG